MQPFGLTPEKLRDEKGQTFLPSGRESKATLWTRLVDKPVFEGVDLGSDGAARRC